MPAYFHERRFETRFGMSASVEPGAVPNPEDVKGRTVSATTVVPVIVVVGGAILWETLKKMATHELRREALQKTAEFDAKLAVEAIAKQMPKDQPFEVSKPAFGLIKVDLGHSPGPESPRHGKGVGTGNVDQVPKTVFVPAGDDVVEVSVGDNNAAEKEPKEGKGGGGGGGTKYAK